MKNFPIVIAVVCAIIAGVIWYEVQGRAQKKAAQNTLPAAVTAPAQTAPAEAPPQTKAEEKKAKNDDVIIG